MTIERECMKQRFCDALFFMWFRTLALIVLSTFIATWLSSPTDLSGFRPKLAGMQVPGSQSATQNYEGGSKVTSSMWLQKTIPIEECHQTTRYTCIFHVWAINGGALEFPWLSIPYLVTVLSLTAFSGALAASGPMLGRCHQSRGWLLCQVRQPSVSMCLHSTTTQNTERSTT